MIDRFAMLSPELLRILDSLDDGILIFDQANAIVFSNKAASRLYRLSQSELAGRCGQYLAEKGYVDHSFSNLAFQTKKSLTYEQTTKWGDVFLNTAYPVDSENRQPPMVIEQIRNLKSMEFYEPDFPFPQPPVPASHQEAATPSCSAPPAEFKSPAMQSVYRLADSIAPKNINVLILGRSGTGKSLLALRIHNNSARKSGPFVTINCAAIPESLIESELFGYLKGAFSGASSKGKQGLMETAQGGTLFLDEIGDLPLSLQSKLLQFIQEKTYTPIGGVHPIHIDTRIIAATNRDLSSLVNGGSFREDLYYRLATVTILVPPLKDRPEDKRLLLKHFCNVFCLKHETNVSFSSGALDCLCDYSWPGNIREMEHLVEFLVISSQSSYITPDMLPPILRREGAHQNVPVPPASRPSLSESCQKSHRDSDQKSFSAFFQEDAVSETVSKPLCGPDFSAVSEHTLEADLVTASHHGPESELTTAPQHGPESYSASAADYAQVNSLAEFLEAKEADLICALYPEYPNSYKLSRRLGISQSTASRLIRKYIKKRT